MIVTQFQRRISVYVHQPNKIMINENSMYIIYYITYDTHGHATRT